MIAVRPNPTVKFRRPKLLFLASPFPPLPAVACVRTWNIAKHLARLGWEVTVVTPNPSIFRNSEDPERVSIELEKEGIRRILTDHRWRFLRPEILVCSNSGLGWLLGATCRRVTGWLQIDRGVGWVAAAEQACASLTPYDVDLILATGSPFSSFDLAKRLSDKLGRPYVLDYRDSWTENVYASSRAHSYVIRKEKKLLAGCAAVLTVSSSWAEAMSRRFDIGAKLHVITNGYDTEELSRVEPREFGHFAIVYTGSFYPPKRVITPVMAALRGIKQGGKVTRRDWYFHYFGKEENHVREEAAKYGILDHVVLHGNVSRDEALSAVRGADMAVVVTSIEDIATQKNAGMIPAKLFESVGMKTPTLIVGPPGTDVDGIVDTAGLAHRFAGTEVGAMTAFINSVMSGESPGPKKPETYGWNTISEKLNHILREVVDLPEQKRSYGTRLAASVEQSPV